jgi:hypothetical protein
MRRQKQLKGDDIMSGRVIASMVVILFVGTLTVSSCSPSKKETNITIAQVPPPVRATIEKVTAGSRIKEIERIECGGKVTYEVEYTKDGNQREVEFSEDGKMLNEAQ